MFVDSHVHPLADDPARYPLAASVDSAEAWYAGTHFTAEACLGAADQAGVDRVVLVSSFTAYGNDNSYAADAASRYPERFIGVCRIDGTAADAPAVLRHWIEERGMRGVRLGVADARVDPTCELARDLGVPVAFQVARSEIGQVRRVAERYPDLRVILDHLAHPDIAGGPPYAAAHEFFALAECPNLFCKLSSLNIRESDAQAPPRAFFGALVERFGPERLLWGSDFPHSQGTGPAAYAELVDLARETLGFLTAGEREQIFGGTALRLYPALNSGG